MRQPGKSQDSLGLPCATMHNWIEHYRSWTNKSCFLRCDWRLGRRVFFYWKFPSWRCSSGLYTVEYLFQVCEALHPCVRTLCSVYTGAAQVQSFRDGRDPRYYWVVLHEIGHRNAFRMYATCPRRYTRYTTPPSSNSILPPTKHDSTFLHCLSSSLQDDNAQEV